LTHDEYETEYGRRMGVAAEIEVERARVKWGGSPSLDRLRYNGKAKKSVPLPNKASMINRMLLKKLDVKDIAECIQTSKQAVGQIVAKYNLPRSEV